MPSRLDIIDKIGKDYFVENIENGEFSYPKALKIQGKTIDKKLITSQDGTKHKNLDIRFVKDNISILVETKDNYDNWDKDKILFQMQAYVNYEKVLTGNKIIAILANKDDDRFKVWWGSDLTIDESHQLNGQYALKSFDEYADLYLGKTNNKEKVIKSTYELNDLLFTHGIDEKIRSQFVGTCLLALKNGLTYEHQLKNSIMGGIEEVITNLLDKDLNKAQKLVILKTKVLESQDVRALDAETLQEILRKIEFDILPYINDKNTQGQDILNLFFTTFNKFAGKEDKNQAFTPDHIVHFMCQVVGINRHSRVLDPTCGSGAFLVRAMTEAMDDCANKEERDRVKREQIYGIEWEEKAFGLSTTNMLIHSDGNSNVKQGNCFELDYFIENANINTVLMNPPYNAQRKCSQREYATTWSKKTKEDPSKGFHYVYYIASKVKTGKLAVLLPMACAIGSKNEKEIRKFKQKMLEEHTLDAVFSLPPDMFHPGASANACCMVFDLGKRHYKKVIDKNGKEKFIPRKETFFGYFKDDGFHKKKNLGRVEKTKDKSNEGVWSDIESKWLELYKTRKSLPGLSVVKEVFAKDEWLAEAYMATDYSTLKDIDFEMNIRAFLSSKILQNKDLKIDNFKKNTNKIVLMNPKEWKPWSIEQLFGTDNIQPTKGTTTNELIDGSDIPYISAKKEINGLEKLVSNETTEFISKGNCIIFIQLGAGSAGFTTYQDDSFIGMYGKTICAYHEKLNVYNGIFLETIFDKERPKYSFGRSWTGNRLLNTTIKLPAIKKDNGTYEPDWDYMEKYIKSLPYADLI